MCHGRTAENMHKGPTDLPLVVPGGSPSCRQLTCLLTLMGDAEDPDRGRREEVGVKTMKCHCCSNTVENRHYQSYCVGEQFESIIGGTTDEDNQ